MAILWTVSVFHNRFFVVYIFSHVDKEKASPNLGRYETVESALMFPSDGNIAVAAQAIMLKG